MVGVTGFEPARPFRKYSRLASVDRLPRDAPYFRDTLQKTAHRAVFCALTLGPEWFGTDERPQAHRYESDKKEQDEQSLVLFFFGRSDRI